MRTIEIQQINLDGTRAKIAHILVQNWPEHPVYNFVTPLGAFLAKGPLMPVIVATVEDLYRCDRMPPGIPANGAN